MGDAARLVAELGQRRRGADAAGTGPHGGAGLHHDVLVQDR